MADQPATQNINDGELEGETFEDELEKNYKWAVDKKDQGNDQFQRRDYIGAINAYMEGISYFSLDKLNQIQPAEARKKVLDLITKLLNNTSQCYIALEKWDEALEICDKVMRLDPNELKSYYRAGLCLKNMGKLQESFAKLNMGSEMAKSVNVQTTPEYVILKNEVAKQLNADHKAQKQLYSNLYNKKKEKEEEDQNKNQNSQRNTVMSFAMFSVLGGVASYIAMDTVSLLSSIKGEEKIAVASAVGAGIGSIFALPKPYLKALGAGIALAGCAWGGFRILEKNPNLLNFK